MKKDLRGKQILAGTVAAMLCLSGCSSAENAETPQNTEQPTQASQLVQEQVNTTDPSTMDSTMEATTPQQTQGRADPTVPTAEGSQQQTPTQPTTKPLDGAQASAVVSRTISELQSQLPKLQYDSFLNAGSVVPLFLDSGKSADAMSSSLVAQIKQFCGTPGEEYSYKLTYAGIAENGVQHCFEFTYFLNEEVVQTPKLDGQAVADRVTQNVLGSSRVSVTTFSGGDYKDCRTLNTIPLFYTTEEAVASLTSTVIDAIYYSNRLDTVYTQFRLVYSSEGETAYVFLLYLK